MVLNNLAFPEEFFFVGVGIVAAWLIALTVLLIQVFQHYGRLTKNVTKKDLKSVLDEILAERKTQTRILQELEERLKKLERDGLGHLQKVGFLRFNPFADTGGEQSFILAFLDDRDNGVVFSSLHGRGTTRLYAKNVIKGKGKDFELSEEEKKVIKQAKKLN
jgi:hypothetical protein